jgi:hypothetical protein
MKHGEIITYIDTWDWADLALGARALLYVSNS